MKTVVQMVMVCLLIANIPQISVIAEVTMWLALVLTVVSLGDYLLKNMHILFDKDVK